MGEQADRTPVEEIQRLIDTVYASFVDGDVRGIENCLDDSATVWDVFTPDLIVGTAQRHDFHARDRAQMLARGPLHLKVGTALVDVRGDVAWARYVVDFRYEPPGEMRGQVRVTDVLVRRADGWRVVHHHEGLVPAGPPARGEPGT
jgi:ketosteroid isomerase-like protein